MKQRLIVLRDRIDAMSVRERVMMFCATVGVVVYVIYSFVLNPLFAREQALHAQISDQRKQVAAIDAEIVALVQAYANDPDAEARARLAVIKNDMLTLSNGMRAMQTGLVAPEQIAPLLETMLKANGRLRLVGLTTLPVSSLTDDPDGPAPPPAAAPATGVPPEAAATLAAAYPNAAPAGAAPAQAAAMVSALAPGAAPAATPAPPPTAPVVTAPAVPLLYRHGVELAVSGNYLDMVRYMEALEAMPAQLIWSKASLTVDEYPNARLTLRVYTLSLDKKWMKL